MFDFKINCLHFVSSSFSSLFWIFNEFCVNQLWSMQQIFERIDLQICVKILALLSRVGFMTVVNLFMTTVS